MSTPEELTQQHEENLKNILRVAVLASDLWSMDNEPWYGTRAEYTRGLVHTAIRHAVEQGLLVLPEDIGERLDQPISMQRQPARQGDQP